MGFYNASAAVRYIVLTLKTLLHWMICRLSPWIVSLNVCTGGELGSTHTLLGCDSGSERVNTYSSLPHPEPPLPKSAF